MTIKEKATIIKDKVTVPMIDNYYANNHIGQSVICRWCGKNSAKLTDRGIFCYRDSCYINYSVIDVYMELKGITDYSKAVLTLYRELIGNSISTTPIQKSICTKCHITNTSASVNLKRLEHIKTNFIPYQQLDNNAKNRVNNYLNKRCIPYTALYLDNLGYKLGVYHSNGHTNLAIKWAEDYYFTRAMTGDFKGDYGAKQMIVNEGISNSNVFVVFEAWGDCMAYLHYATNCNPSKCPNIIILNGATIPKIEQWINDNAHRTDFKVYLLLDNDNTGDKATNAIIEAFPHITRDLRQRYFNNTNAKDFNAWYINYLSITV